MVVAAAIVIVVVVVVVAVIVAVAVAIVVAVVVVATPLNRLALQIIECIWRCAYWHIQICQCALRQKHSKI